MSAACHACLSELLPSVAETSVRSICWKLTGSAPVCSTSARSFASPIEPPAPRSISAFGPGMPSGFCWKSMYGVDWSWPSSTIAKCCAYGLFWGLMPGLPARAHFVAPRCASSFVIFWNWLEPWFVNCRVTIGPPVGPKSARVPESTRSEPVISGICDCLAVACG